MCSEEEREVRSAASQVLPTSPPVPRPANRRAPRGLDARQIVLLLILLSDRSSVRSLDGMSHVGLPKSTPWMDVWWRMVSLEACQQV